MDSMSSIIIIGGLHFLLTNQFFFFGTFKRGKGKESGKTTRLNIHLSTRALSITNRVCFLHCSSSPLRIFFLSSESGQICAFSLGSVRFREEITITKPTIRLPDQCHRYKSNSRLNDFSSVYGSDCCRVLFQGGEKDLRFCSQLCKSLDRMLFDSMFFSCFHLIFDSPCSSQNIRVSEPFQLKHVYNRYKIRNRRNVKFFENQNKVVM